MENFMRKYSFWLTGGLGVIALLVLIFGWSSLAMVQKLPLMYVVALAFHETEELKLPGGFVELVTDMTGLHLKNLGVAKFFLFIFTIYATVLPIFIANYIWPVMATLFIGLIEAVEHLLAARVNKERFYSPGMITALCVQLPVSIYGYWYLYSNDLVHGIYWLWSILFILVPMLIGQRVIVKSNGLEYKTFLKDAYSKMLAKKAK